MDVELDSFRRSVGGETEFNQDQERNLLPAKTTQFTTSIRQSSPDGNGGAPISKRAPRLSWLNNHWVLEIASCIGGLVALFGIIGVLVKYDGTAIPNWPYGITINSVLSWIVLVFNALMLGTIATCFGQMAWVNFSMAPDKPLSDINSYHWASRGAIGCIVFIWESGMRNWASLGALATILAVGVSPLVQQMATVQNNAVPVSLPAYVGRAQTYFESEEVPGQPFSQPPDGMLGAIYGFLLASPGSSSSDADNRSTASHPSIPVTCPSGYCDFSPFRSLAVCSECSDISNALTSHCESGACTPEKTMCNYLLPNGMQVNISDYIRLPGTFFQANVSYTEMAPHGGLWSNDRSMILNLTEIRIPSLTNITDLTNALATQCALYWCVNTYSATVRNHTLFETLVDSWHDSNPQHTIIAPGESRIDFQPPTKDNLTQSKFTLYAETSLGIQSWLRNKMETGNIPESECLNGGRPAMSSPLRPPTEFLRPMLRSRLNDVFQNLAAAMTTRVRQLDWSAQNEKPSARFGPLEGVGVANGTSFAMETQIKVQWAWIVLPSLLFVLTALFLGITMLETKQKGLRAWKSSPTAAICSGLDENTQQQVRAAEDPVEMEALAADIQVHLQKGKTDTTGSSWRLKASQSSAQY
ncbi:hypothetical protein BDW59DRAFT_176440 [Aspergillus cavernicola]|uniref:Uncharacterized protein n=1 Tax=Aspergillus cavernicola TaxID=176166 RepID=A0ABR4HG92_9EURO